MSRICPKCSTENPSGARYCFNPDCRTELDPQAEGQQLPDVRDGQRLAIPMWAKLLLPISLIGFIGLVARVARSHPTPRRVPPTTVGVAITAFPTTTSVVPTTSSPATTTTVAGVIGIASASASSTLPSTPTVKYGIENTYDLRDNTAWNSDGSAGKQAPEGQKLTYTFATPQDIGSIRIMNGFDRPTDDRKFTDNYRVKGLIIRAGGQQTSVELQDAREPQRISDLGLKGVASVEFEIVSVYPTTKWTDVAINEIQFFPA